MELQAIIGARKGKLKFKDKDKILSYLYLDKNKIFSHDNCQFTNSKKFIRSIIPLTPLVNSDGKNIYIRTSNLASPQAFYHFLSQNGLALIDSKLIMEKDYKTKQ